MILYAYIYVDELIVNADKLLGSFNLANNFGVVFCPFNQYCGLWIKSMV